MSDTSDLPRRQLNLRLLEILVAVVNAKGMKGAAASLKLSQSAISQAIANLESMVDGQLIDRGRRPLKLTMLGEIIHRHSIDILDRVNELDRAVEMHTHNALPMLRLGITNTVAGTVGPHLVRNLDKLAAQWIIWSGYSETTVNSLIERKVDFIITAEDTPSDTEFINIPVFEEPYILVVPSDLTKTHKTVEALAATTPFIRYGTKSFIGPAVDAWLQRMGLVLPNRYRLDTSDAVLAMVEEGIGWTISTPLSILKSRMNSPRFKCLPLPKSTLVRRIALIARATENVGVAHKIAKSTSEGLKFCLPDLRKIAPKAKFRTDFP